MNRARTSTVLLCVLGMAAITNTAVGQNAFNITLLPDPAAISPAAGAHGSGLLVFDDALKTIDYRIEIASAASITGAALHVGELGLVGPALFTLDGGPSVFEGTSTPLTVDQESLLKNNGLYIGVSSVSNPSGESRAQVTAGHRAFVALANGAGVVPPTSSVMTAIGGFGISGALGVNQPLLVYNVEIIGAVNAPVSAELRVGAPGQVGPVIATLDLVGSGASSALLISTEDAKRIRNELVYLQINGAVEADNIRGQLAPSFTEYGEGCNGIGGTGLPFPPPQLSATGAPTPGSPLTLMVAGAFPNTPGILFIGVGASLTPTVDDCRWFVGQPAIPVVLVTPASGNLTVEATIPLSAPASTWIQMQFYGQDPVAPSGLYSTNGLAVQIVD